MPTVPCLMGLVSSAPEVPRAGRVHRRLDRPRRAAHLVGPLPGNCRVSPRPCKPSCKPSYQSALLPIMMVTVSHECRIAKSMACAGTGTFSSLARIEMTSTVPHILGHPAWPAVPRSSDDLQVPRAVINDLILRSLWSHGSTTLTSLQKELGSQRELVETGNWR